VQDQRQLIQAIGFCFAKPLKEGKHVLVQGSGAEATHSLVGWLLPGAIHNVNVKAFPLQP